METKGLIWEIMRVEAQVKWANVEIQSIKTDQALLENKKDNHLTPKLERLEQRVQVAEDFLDSAENTLAQFDRTRELLSQPAVIKQLDWMRAMGSFLEDVEQFERLARHSIEDFATVAKRERCVRRAQERKHSEKSLDSSNDHSSMAAPDNQMRLEELRVQYSTLEERLARLKILRNIRANQVGHLNQKIKLGERIIKSLEEDIKKAEGTHGASGLFEQVMLLQQSLRSPFWIAGVKDKDGNEVEESKVSVGPENFFQNLVLYIPPFLNEVIFFQKERYNDLRGKMLAALSDQNLPDHLSISLGKALNNSFRENVYVIIKRHKAEVDAAEKGVGDDPAGTS
ncbi:hypothetical protein IFR05_004245 [Cadophora sp. M221]|nr:hypothetical protein IFR05_004245 [Cadophora sp. M221]